MKKLRSGWALRMLAAMVFDGVGSVAAELPSLQIESRWLGYFVGFENRDCVLTVAAKSGQIVLRPVGKNGKMPAQRVFVAFDIQALETLPDGSTKLRNLIPASLESEHEATQSPKNLIIRGKVAEGAAFEFNLNENRGKFTLGGRITEPGKITNPLRFAVRVKIQNAYPSEKPNPDRNQQKTFENKTKGDKLQLTLADGKRLRLSTSDLIAADDDRLNGSIATAAQVEFNSWLGNRLQIEASEGSTLQMEASTGKLLWQGVTWIWSPDPKKDLESKATLEVSMK